MPHMTEGERQIGIRALQQNASAIVERAAAGEAIEITARGRPVARLVPLAGGLDGLVRAGLARSASRRVRDLPDPLPASRARPSLGRLLEDARAGER